MSARRPSRSAGIVGCSAIGLDAAERRRHQRAASRSAWPTSASSACCASAICSLERLDLLARLGQAAFALAQFEAGVEAGGDAVAHQLQRFLALRQRALGHGQLVAQARPLDVAARDVAGEQDAGGIGIGGGGVGAADRGIERRAVLAEEVELPAAVELQRAGLLDRAAERRRVDVVVAELLAREIERAVDLRLVGRLGDGDRGLRAWPGAHGATCRFGLPCSAWSIRPFELRVAEGEPPVAVDRAGVGLRREARPSEARVAQLWRASRCRAMSAQPASASDQRGGQAHGAAARRAQEEAESSFFFSTGREGLCVVEDAAQVALELLPLLER